MNDNKQIQARNRQKLCFRIGEGIRTALRPPCLGLLPIMALVILLYISLSNRMTIFDTGLMPEQLARVIDYIKIAAIIAVFLVFLLSMLTLLGRPYKWKVAEAAALSAFKLQTTPEECPLLISSRRMKNGSRRWEFFSMWVPMRKWQIDDNINDICHSLEGHLVGQVEHGGKNKNDCHRIVFYTNPGARSANRGTLTDEEI